MKDIINSWNTFLDVFEKSVLNDHGYLILGIGIAVLVALFALLCYRARTNRSMGRLISALMIVWAVILVFVAIWYIISLTSNVLFTGVV